MNNTNTSQPTLALDLPPGMTIEDLIYPVYYLDTTQINLNDSDSKAIVNNALYDLFCLAHDGAVKGQTLIKLHIGEPRCKTRLRPEYTASIKRFLEHQGADSVVAGDSTVAYTGMRGHKQNPIDDVSSYMNLAEKHGWSVNGTAGVPFVVLDRPCSAIQGVYEFGEEQQCRKVDGVARYTDFFLSGGFAEADFIVNSAHLTLHGLAGLAGCVKNIAMGCAGLTGKLRMHQFLLPGFDGDLCTRCGICVANCPEDALSLTDTDLFPWVAEGVCIGCGECVSLCPSKAVKLSGKDINDWSRGEETLPVRMADYTIGLMNGFWDKSLHVLHMYSITELCDCVDKFQKPFVDDLGFVVSKNPFAVDLVSADLLSRKHSESVSVNIDKKIKSAELIADYVKEKYGIFSKVPVHKVVIKK